MKFLMPQGLTHIKCSINNNDHFFTIMISVVSMVCDFLYPQPACGLPRGNEHTFSFQHPHTPAPAHGSLPAVVDDLQFTPNPEGDHG